jgi:putative membrane protein
MIAKLIILSISIFLIAQFLPGVKLKKPITAVVVAVIYSLINFAVGWLLALLALPFIILTLGLFHFVINAFLLWVTDKILDDFEIDTIKTTFIAAIFITIINAVLNWIF